jgi:iron complex outermembrane recepter protein
LTLVGCAFASAAAFGQSATMSTGNSAPRDDSSGTALQEIVVTAQRRAENLQDVPIAVTALSGEQMQAQGIRQAIGLNMAVPGLTISQYSQGAVIFLRGVGNSNPDPGQEQNVAIYVDGVYYSSIVSDMFSFNDLASVEVLKGPQGTLFGRNTTGGVIQATTKDPEQDFSGKVSVGYESFDTTKTNGYITGGLAPNLAGALSVNYVNQGDGWGEDLVTGQKVNLTRDLDAHGKLLWEPSSDTKVTLMVAFSSIFSDLGLSRNLVPGEPTLPPSYLTTGFKGTIYDDQSNGLNGNWINQKIAALHVEQDLGFSKFVSITSAQYVADYSHNDVDGTPAFIEQGNFLPQRDTTYTEELQLQSEPTSTIRWIVGTMYFNDRAGENPLEVDLAGDSPFILSNTTTGTKSYAAFAQATAPIATDTNLTLGGRYTDDHKDIEGSYFYQPAGTLPVEGSKSWGDFTYKASLDHHFTKNVMVYAGISTGFKSGVYNLISPVSTNGPTLGKTLAPVSPEKLTDYEGGVKMELFDHKLRLNFDGFYYNYKDLQQTQFEGTTSVITNAAAAKVYGLENEIEAVLTNQLSLKGGIAWMHSEYTNFKNAPSNPLGPDGIGAAVPGGVDATGNQLIEAPELTADIGLDYKKAFPYGTLGASAIYAYNSGYFFEVDNRLHQPDYSLVNGELSWLFPDNRVQLRLYATNLTNRLYYSKLDSAAGAPDQGTPGAPRIIGGAVEVKF